MNCKSAFEKFDLWACFGITTLTWLVGWISWDHWLTPIAKWLLYCSLISVALSFSIWLLRRATRLAVCLLAIELVVAFILPAESRSSRLKFINDNTDQVEVIIRDTQIGRVKQFKLPPNSQVEFTYFLGDGGFDIPVIIVISNIDRGFVSKYKITLTPRQKMNDILLSQLKDSDKYGGQ